MPRLSRAVFGGIPHHITQRGNRQENVFFYGGRLHGLSRLDERILRQTPPLDDAYLWAVIRYVERNPVRAKLVLKAEEYPWSSAPAHCGLAEDLLLSQRLSWKKQQQQIIDGSSWLAQGDEPQALEVLRRNVEKGLPCGTEKFVQSLEKIAGRVLQYRPIGRPRKKKGSVPFSPLAKTLVGRGHVVFTSWVYGSLPLNS